MSATERRHGEQDACPTPTDPVACPSATGLTTCPTATGLTTCPTATGLVTCPTETGLVTCAAAAEQDACSTPDTVVLGVGNELFRDEGVGVVVVRELARQGVPAGVLASEGALGGINLLFEMEGAQRVVIVDAVDMGAAPGTVRVFSPEEVRMEGAPIMASLHQVGLKEILELGAVVGLTADVRIVGIQPQEVAAGFGLTDTVAAAVPRAVAHVRRLLADS